MNRNDELLAGVRIRIEVDSSDPRFQIVTLRTPCNSQFGGTPVPPCDLYGERAHRRYMRFMIRRVAGMVQDGAPESVLRFLERCAKRYDEKAS